MAEKKEINRLFVWAGGRKNFVALVFGLLFGGFMLVGTFLLEWYSKASTAWYDFAKFFIGSDTTFIVTYVFGRVIQKHSELKFGNGKWITKEIYEKISQKFTSN